MAPSEPSHPRAERHLRVHGLRGARGAPTQPFADERDAALTHRSCGDFGALLEITLGGGLSVVIIVNADASPKLFPRPALEAMLNVNEIRMSV